METRRVETIQGEAVTTFTEKSKIGIRDACSYPQVLRRTDEHVIRALLRNGINERTIRPRVTLPIVSE